MKILITILTYLILLMVRLLGVEPRTSWSVAKRSIQLSYRRILFSIKELGILEAPLFAGSGMQQTCILLLIVFILLFVKLNLL